MATRMGHGLYLKVRGGGEQDAEATQEQEKNQNTHTYTHTRTKQNCPDTNIIAQKITKDDDEFILCWPSTGDHGAGP